MNKNRIYLLLIIIGILLISVAGPAFGMLLSRTLIDQGPKTIDEDSITGFSERYSQGFSIQNDQTCYIEFSNYYPNVTVDLIILTKNEYDYYDSLNGSNPNNGEAFILYQRQTGSNPSVTFGLTSLQIAWDGSTYGNYVFIEFRGTNRISIPGNYYVVIRGQNDYAGNDEVKFDIKLSIDGPGEMLQDTMVYIGIILISFVGILYTYSIIKKYLGER